MTYSSTAIRFSTTIFQYKKEVRNR